MSVARPGEGLELRDFRKLAATRYPIEDAAAALARGRGVALAGPRGSYLAYVFADIVRRADRPWVVVVATSQAARVTCAALETLLAGRPGRRMLMPVPETSPYIEMTPDRATTTARLEAAWDLADLAPGDVMVVPLPAWVRKAPPSADVREAALTLVAEEDIDTAKIDRQLRAMGYHAVGLVEDCGSFSLRGGVLDIFSPRYPQPFRIDLFGDTIESIRWFDPETQRSGALVERVVAIPAREELTGPEQLATARTRIRALADELRVPSQKVTTLLKDLERGERPFGIETLLPAFSNALEPLFRRLGDRTGLLFVDPIDLLSELDRLRQARQREREREAEAGSLAFAVDEFMLTEGELIESFGAGGCRVEAGARDTGGSDLLELPFPFVDNAEVERARKQRGSDETAVAAVLSVIDGWRDAAGRLVLSCSTRAAASRVMDVLRSYGREVAWLGGVDELFAYRPPPFERIEVMVGDLVDGFVAPSRSLAVVTDREVFGRSTRRSGREQAHDATAVASFQELQPGDLVVHIDFGVAKYAGLQRLRVGDNESDFLTLEFSDGDRIYVPVYRLGKVQRYMGSAAFTRLDKLGGTTWERTKARIKAQLADVAEELLRLYAERASQTGYAFSAPDETYHEFEASFPYEETPHQAKAIEDVLSDMQSDKPMDRLLCGDVGFGKTEVAIRAAYKAVCDGRQVAVLVPTTVLTEQHLQTFRRRLADTAARVEALSRFRSTAEVRRILSDAREGKVDVLIGTHRLLSKDVDLPNLGLLVIDEEQRFGVQHKERIKQLRATVDVLTMTATPIPRTLELSLLGIRDLSLITTPPPGRLSVKTHLARYRENVIREGILGELERGGQVFFVHNRVDTIYAVADELRRMVPEARIGVGHAQLRDEELEQVMMDFINRRLDVLVSTTIVESGIDISTANTMFINNADKFGLSQLHQLRGRVGRGQDRAFCYLLVGDPNRLPPDAKRRLDVLLEHSELGSGLVVAQQDLDMRGAGNILGSDQSGHIEAVGFELYAELLEEAVRELQGKPKEAEVEPEVKIPAVAFVPEDYVADIGQRLTLYKRLSLAADDAAVYDIVAEMQDRYGPLPESVEHLRDVVLVKQIMKRIRAKQIEAGPKAVVVELLPETRLVPQKVLDLIKVHRGAYEMRPNLVIVRKLDPRDGIPVLSSALTVARELAACVGS